MICMKCGRDTDTREVFCDACLEDMKRHPISPTTRVNILPRTTKRRAPVQMPEPQAEPQDNIHVLRRTVKYLQALLLCSLLALAGLIAFTGWYICGGQTPSVGQNYHTYMDGESTP